MRGILSYSLLWKDDLIYVEEGESSDMWERISVPLIRDALHMRNKNSDIHMRSRELCVSQNGSKSLKVYSTHAYYARTF